MFDVSDILVSASPRWDRRALPSHAFMGGIAFEHLNNVSRVSFMLVSYLFVDEFKIAGGLVGAPLKSLQRFFRSIPCVFCCPD